MPAVKVFRHVLRNHSFIEFEQVQIAPPHLRCDFEANMQQLAKAAVIDAAPGTWRSAEVYCSEDQARTSSGDGSFAGSMSITVA